MTRADTDFKLQAFSLERMVQAVEDIRRRLLKATAALEAAGVPYAVVGGHAVAAWVTRVDKAAVRSTQDVDILLRRADLGRARRVLEESGFFYRETMDVHMFLDGPDASPRDAVHIVFAGEKVQDDYASAAPEVQESVAADRYRVVDLEPLVRMKLTSYRRKDQVHLLDLIQIGLITDTWPMRFDAPLRSRLRELLDDPEG
jgi:hypothetical protein